MTDDIGVHPTADLFPMLPDDELADLASDIKERGQLQPIVLDNEGRILDGRNRHAACKLAGVEPQFETYSGDDPDGYALAVNISRRHLTTGARAVITAKASKMLGRGRQKPLAKSADLHFSRITEASIVLEWAPDLADAIVAGARPLSSALDIARERKKEAAELTAKMDRLGASAPDLRALVDEERMTVDDATAAMDSRERKAREEAAAQERAEQAARQESLNAYNAAVDGLTRALSYAKTYDPPAGVPANYLPPAGFVGRVEELLNIAEKWNAE